MFSITTTILLKRKKSIPLCNYFSDQVKNVNENKFDVIYSDNHIIVINKPAGILSQGDKSQSKSILDDIKDYIREKYKKPGNIYVGLVHRLDRPTSGLMIFAKTSKAAARLSEDFRERRIRKKYVCIVNGELPGSGELMHNIKKNKKYHNHDKNHQNRIHLIQYNEKDINSIPARLSYQSLVTFYPDWVEIMDELDSIQPVESVVQTLLQVTLETGRKHQIRAQLATIGHPIVGDVKYGATHSFITKDICLHSYSLTIIHPISKQKMLFTALPPENWLKRFGKDVIKKIETLIVSEIRNNKKENV